MPRPYQIRGPGDAPALAVDNAGGIVHAGSAYLQPVTTRGDACVTLAALGDAVRAVPERVGAVRGRIARVADDRFVALATAFQNCGACVDVPPGIALEGSAADRLDGCARTPAGRLRADGRAHRRRCARHHRRATCRQRRRVRLRYGRARRRSRRTRRLRRRARSRRRGARARDVCGALRVRRVARPARR